MLTLKKKHQTISQKKKRKKNKTSDSRNINICCLMVHQKMELVKHKVNNVINYHPRKV